MQKQKQQGRYDDDTCSFHDTVKTMISITTENIEQFYAALEEETAELVYADAGSAEPAEYRHYAEAAHKAGKYCGLRLPHIWREEAEAFFEEHAEEVRNAGFDRWLFRNIEALCFFEEHGLLHSVPYALDHSIYVTNRDAAAMILELLPDGGRGLKCMTCPLELNAAELRTLCSGLNSAAGGPPQDAHGVYNGMQVPMELVVYGRAPMMISAQCLKKTTGNCDRLPSVTVLEDRKGAHMPVINCCRFCCNTVFNAVPTMLYDLTEEIRSVGASSYRYEFTVETAEEVHGILSGTLRPGAFTRGHFKKSVL